MTQKLNWKAKALSQYKTAIATTEAMKGSEDKRDTALALIQVGRAMALAEILEEYGVNVDDEKFNGKEPFADLDEGPKILLPGAM
jgi:hypothetical protein